MDTAKVVLEKAPPVDMAKNVQQLKSVFVANPEVRDAIQKAYQLPFQVWDEPSKDAKEKPFLICHNNMVDDKFRSPWTYKLYSKGEKPEFWYEKDDFLMELEARFNGVWEAYKKLYYGGEAVSSVYLTETEDKKFEAFFAIHKKSAEGRWDSCHLVRMDDPKDTTCKYHVSSVLWLVLNPEVPEKTTLDVSLVLTKDVSKDMKINRAFLDASHMENIGGIIEQNEIEFRSNLEQVHLPNTKQIIDTIQKEPQQPKQANPLMGMIMDSSVLKKKLASRGN